MLKLLFLYGPYGPLLNLILAVKRTTVIVLVKFYFFFHFQLV